MNPFLVVFVNDEEDYDHTKKTLNNPSVGRTTGPNLPDFSEDESLATSG